MATRSWIDEIRRWIRTLIKPKRKRPAPLILERFPFTSCGLVRLARDTTGSVDSWRIIPRYGENDFLIALDSFAKLRSQVDFEKSLRGKESRTPSRRHTLTAEAENLLSWQPSKRTTHLFWVSKVSRLPVGGDIKMEAIGIWAFDLEGLSPAWAGHDRYPQAITRRAVKSIASLPEPDFSIKIIDRDAWLLAVAESAKAFLGQLHQV